MLKTEIAMKNRIGFGKPLRKIAGPKGPKSEAHVFGCGVAARLPLAEFRGVGFHRFILVHEEISIILRAIASGKRATSPYRGRQENGRPFMTSRTTGT